jgi:two-component system nitrogen regulation response regulator GlnG
MQKVLIVDDDEGVCYSLARLLASDECRVTAVQTPDAGFEAMRGEDPDLVLLDVKIGQADGLQVLTQIRQQRPRQQVVVMTAHGTTETAIEAMKRGAFDYLTKPFDPHAIQTVVSRALSTARLNRHLETGGENNPASRTENGIGSDRMIGRSSAMQQAYKMIGQVAPRDVPVLIRGESGTGKELAARAIWQHSRRSGKPFLAVNCAALAETLLESELFGHEKGAFTGAESRKLGKFEQANGGTLYLDEVGDMSLATQAKILRVLQDGAFQRVGGYETIKVDVRIIAATHQDLERRIRDGLFREDLYYRLKVVELTMPSLRERKEDIPELARYLLFRHRRALGSEAQGFSSKALDALVGHEWPGNVRELENIVRRAMVLCNGPTITTENLDFGPISNAALGHLDVKRAAADSAPVGLVATAPSGNGTHTEKADVESLVERLLASGKDSLIEEMERLLIARALEKMNGNQLRTAKLLGITRNTLRSRIEKFGLKPKVNVV